MRVVDLIWLGQQLSNAGRAEIESNAPGVPIAELLVMDDVVEHTPTSISEISERTGYAQSRVSTAVAQIVRRGWAHIESDPGDGRRTLVAVTQDMQRDTRRFQRKSRQRPFEQLLAGLPAHRRSTVLEALEDLYQSLRSLDAPS